MNLSIDPAAPMNVYPNPSLDGRIMISLSNKEDLKIEVYSSDGKKVFERKTNQSFELVLGSGIYLINSTDVKNKMISKKIIIL